MPGFEWDGAQAGGARLAGHAPLDRGNKPATELQAPSPAAGPEHEADDPGSLVYLQQTAGNSAVNSMLAPSPGDLVRSVVDSPGKPLDGPTSSFVKSATGQDTSGIQVHEGPEAAEAARSVDADMFASGTHLVAPDGLDVTTRQGAFKTLHEVHHIVNQQAKGPVDGKETEDGLKISDPADQFEQEADQVAAKGVAEHFDAG